MSTSIQEPVTDGLDSADRPKRRNQHKPVPPTDKLEYWIRYYWHLGFPDTKVADHCMDHFDRQKYGLSSKTVQRLRRKFDLKGTIQQNATFETLTDIYSVIRGRFPRMGARRMVTIIRQDYSIKVSEKLVNEFLRSVEPDAVEARTHARVLLVGVMEYWSIDQYDKWGRFGLWLHLGIDPYSGRIAWLKIWWCNSNPGLLISYYLEAGRQVGGIPLFTMSDHGQENNGIANVHSTIRHQLDPLLHGTMQHRWCSDKTNTWSQFRSQWAPGFEDLLDHGINTGIYNPSDPLENLVFRWIAIPWLQAEIDRWVQMHNSSPRRANKKKLLPPGIPDLIHQKPERFQTRNFQVMVSPDMFDKLWQEWVQPDDAVFHLTPPMFHAQVDGHYISLGRPAICRGNFWDIYTQLLDCFHTSPCNPIRLGVDNEMEVMAGLQELQQNLDDDVVSEYAAEFTDSDMDNGDVVMDDGYDSVYAAEFTDSGGEKE